MADKELDFKELDEELIEIYDSTKRPSRSIEKKIREWILGVEN
ncbi:MAG: hypothetical protein ACTSQI_13830 [Candidatus Helarchaeota archaeon]